MKFGYAIFGAVLLAIQGVVANNDDLFNYGMDTFDDDEGESFGQPEWDEVSCDDLDECVSFDCRWMLMLLDSLRFAPLWHSC